MALEELYFGQNVRTAFAVGQARGVVMLAAGQRGLPCTGYTPQQVKGAVCGSGRAQKDQVARMVEALLGLTEEPRPDHAADALAVAICHANCAPLASALAGSAGVIALLRGEVAVRRTDHVVILSGGVGYRAAVSAQTLRARARGRRAGDAAHPPDRARRRARAVRLRLRAGARPVPDAALGPGGRPEGRAGGALRRRRRAS